MHGCLTPSSAKTLKDVLPKYLTKRKFGRWRRHDENLPKVPSYNDSISVYIYIYVCTPFPIKTKCCFAIRGAPLGVWKWHITRTISAEGVEKWGSSPTVTVLVLQLILCDSSTYMSSLSPSYHITRYAQRWLAIFEWETGRVLTMESRDTLNIKGFNFPGD